MDYRGRKYYLLSTYSGYMEDIIEIIKQQLGTKVKIHKLPSTNIPISYCKIMISCNFIYQSTLNTIINTISLLLKNKYRHIGYPEYYKRKYYNQSERIYFKEITEEDLKQ